MGPAVLSGAGVVAGAFGLTDGLAADGLASGLDEIGIGNTWPQFGHLALRPACSSGTRNICEHLVHLNWIATCKPLVAQIAQKGPSGKCEPLVY